jgi:pimeloyl-ACP methyl ester carboxylesterase
VYTVTGADDGTPVLVHHGAPGSRHVATLLDEPARAAGVRLVVPDRPGYGGSPPQSEWTFTDWPRQASAIFDAEGIETAALLGFSGGTRPALALAAERPPLVSRVALLSPAGPPDAPRAGPARLLGALARHLPFLLGPLLGVQSRYLARSDSETVAALVTDADLSAETTEVVARTICAAFEGGTDGLLRETLLSVRPWAFDPDAIDAPIWIGRGSDDANVPTVAVEQLVERLPSPTYRVFDGRDHFTTLQFAGPDAFDWLGS